MCNVQYENAGFISPLGVKLRYTMHLWAHSERAVRSTTEVTAWRQPDSRGENNQCKKTEAEHCTNIMSGCTKTQRMEEKLGNLIQSINTTHQVYESCFLIPFNACVDIRDIKFSNLLILSYIVASKKIYQHILLLQYYKLQQKFHAT